MNNTEKGNLDKLFCEKHKRNRDITCDVCNEYFEYNSRSNAEYKAESEKGKCMVEVPSYDEDGTEKDRDYWFGCLNEMPCLLHAEYNPKEPEKGKQDWIEKLQEISSLWLYDGAEWENAILFIEELLTSQEKKIREEYQKGGKKILKRLDEVIEYLEEQTKIINKEQ